MLWILYTITACTLQTFRNLEQKNLNKKLDSLTVSWSRFILPLPFAVAVAACTAQLISKEFILYCLVTAIFQVAGNVFLLQTLKSKNFSVGITFYKTETLQAMIIGLLFFNEKISLSGFVSIMIAAAGAVVMSGLVFNDGLKEFTKSLKNKSTLYGLLTGFCFSISAFHLKLASGTLQSLGHTNIKSAIVVLMWVICFQNIFFITIKSYQNRLIKDLKSLILSENKYVFFKTSIFSFAGSVFWFAAYGLGKVVYVKAIGQIELVMAIAASYFLLKEKIKKSEIIGIALTSSGILGLILLH